MQSIERKLGFVENVFHIIHNFGGMIDVNIVRVEGEIATNILSKVLDLLQIRHPMLRVRIIELADGNYFNSEEIEKIPLRVIRKTHDRQYLEVAEEELHQKFSREFAPLCRITLLKASAGNSISEIIASFHHAITDGLSCMSLIDELLMLYQKIARGEKISQPIPMPFFPPIEQTLNRNLIEFNDVEKPQSKDLMEAAVPKLIVENEAPPNQRRTHLLTRIISSKTTSKLVDKCKQQKTTVHGALCAAMLFGASYISDFDEPIYFSCSSNINLRKYSKIEINKNDIGCFISSLENVHNLTGDTNFWDLARECKTQVDSSVNKTINNLINNKKSSDVSQQSIQNLLENNSTGRIKTINISNRGKFDLPQSYGELKIKEIYFTVGQHILGPCLWLGAVTFHEQLFCSFAHVTPLIGSRTMDRFANYVLDILQNASFSEYLSLK